MFGLATDTYLLLDALVTIVGLILLITHFKVHPFVALTLAAGFLGLTSGMPVAKVMKSFQTALAVCSASSASSWPWGPCWAN